MKWHRKTVFEVQGIYVIKTLPELPVKIGVTSDLSLRLANLQVGNWNRLEAHWFSFVGKKRGRTKRNFFNSLSRNAKELEAEVHTKMKELDLWVAGEWFACDADAAVAVVQKVASLNDFEFFGIEAARNVKMHGKLYPGDFDAVENMIKAEQSARAALGLDNVPPSELEKT